MGEDAGTAGGKAGTTKKIGVSLLVLGAVVVVSYIAGWLGTHKDKPSDEQAEQCDISTIQTPPGPCTTTSAAGVGGTTTTCWYGDKDNRQSFSPAELCCPNASACGEDHLPSKKTA